MEATQYRWIREFLEDFLIKLGIKADDPMMKQLNDSPNEELPLLFRETVEAIEGSVGGDVLKDLKVRLPGGKEVTYPEAKEWCKTQGVGSPKSYNAGASVKPRKKRRRSGKL